MNLDLGQERARGPTYIWQRWRLHTFKIWEAVDNTALGWVALFSVIHDAVMLWNKVACCHSAVHCGCEEADEAARFVLRLFLAAPLAFEAKNAFNISSVEHVKCEVAVYDKNV